jgi:hypothetical protein
MKLVGIADRDGGKQGTRLLGHKVLSLGEAKDLNPDAILVTSMKDQTLPIKNSIRQREWNSIKIFYI